MQKDVLEWLLGTNLCDEDDRIHASPPVSGVPVKMDEENIRAQKRDKQA